MKPEWKWENSYLHLHLVDPDGATSITVQIAKMPRSDVEYYFMLCIMKLYRYSKTLYFIIYFIDNEFILWCRWIFHLVIHNSASEMGGFNRTSITFTQIACPIINSVYTVEWNWMDPVLQSFQCCWREQWGLCAWYLPENWGKIEREEKKKTVKSVKNGHFWKVFIIYYHCYYSIQMNHIFFMKLTLIKMRCIRIVETHQMETPRTTSGSKCNGFLIFTERW